MMRWSRTLPIACIVITLFAAPWIAPGQQESSALLAPFDLLLTGGRVLDGTGNPWFYADVGIRDNRIVAIGKLTGASTRRVLDVTGKVVAPGIIDVHSHGGGQRGLTSEEPRYRAAPNLVAQGVTTIVVNQDGRSPWPIRDQRATMETDGIGPNALLLIGHGTLRREVMGDDFRRVATKAELRQMQALMKQAMEEGAYGMSGAHEYVPMIWSDTEEIVALVREVAPWEGIYIVHERSSGAQPMWWWPSQDEPGAPTMLDSVVETITVAERTGVTSIQTHLKARGANYWGSGRAIVELIERARARGVSIWGDAYSYNTTGSDGNTILIPRWILQTARERAADDGEPDYAAALAESLGDPQTADLIRKDVAHEMARRGDAENILIVEYSDPALVGRWLRDVALERQLDPVEMALRLQLEGEKTQPGGARLRGFSLSEIDVEAFHAQPWVLSASDAGIALPEDGLVHPRFYGNFPRKIRRYALERRIISVEDAIRSMTSLPAQVLGLRGRGLVREGQWADIVVMDLDTIRDKATALEPHQYPEGVEYVLVNGQFVVEEGRLTNALPGVVITPADRAGL